MNRFILYTMLAVMYVQSGEQRVLELQKQIKNLQEELGELAECRSDAIDHIDRAFYIQQYMNRWSIKESLDQELQTLYLKNDIIVKKEDNKKVINTKGLK